MIDTHATEKSGRRRIFYGWYLVAASVAANTIFSAAYFQGFGILIIPIERAEAVEQKTDSGTDDAGLQLAQRHGR